MKVFLIIPTFNEGDRLYDTYARIPKGVVNNIVIVDDGSIKTIENSKLKRATLLRHNINLGKSAAMKTGADYAFKNKADAVIFMDSDGQHNPQEIEKFVKYLKNGYEIIFGSRQMPIDAPLVRILGSKFASIYINMIFGVYVSDIPSGYRGMTRKAYDSLRWNPSPPPGYDVETEIVARLGRFGKHLKRVEFPVETIYVDKYKGMTIMDAVNILFKSLWWKLSWAFK
jgi:glycosyltransferase involved in cell wall biosynthesis